MSPEELANDTMTKAFGDAAFDPRAFKAITNLMATVIASERNRAAGIVDGTLECPEGTLELAIRHGSNAAMAAVIRSGVECKPTFQGGGGQGPQGPSPLLPGTTPG